MFSLRDLINSQSQSSIPNDIEEDNKDEVNDDDVSLFESGSIDHEHVDSNVQMKKTKKVGFTLVNNNNKSFNEWRPKLVNSNAYGNVSFDERFEDLFEHAKDVKKKTPAMLVIMFNRY